MHFKSDVSKINLIKRFSQMSINKKRFFINKNKQKQIFTNKKVLKRFSLMITHEKKVFTGYHE